MLQNTGKLIFKRLNLFFAQTQPGEPGDVLYCLAVDHTFYPFVRNASSSAICSLRSQVILALRSEYESRWYAAWVLSMSSGPRDPAPPMVPATTTRGAVRAWGVSPARSLQHRRCPHCVHSRADPVAGLALPQSSENPL